MHFPPLAVAPFVLLLLCIAVLPLIAPHLWDSNRNKAWLTLVIAGPLAVWIGLHQAELLGHAMKEYFSFLCLLASLFVVAGSIHISGDLLASPRNNTLILLSGAVLANLLGTTGASMLLIRLLLRTNAQRRNTAHLPVFFIMVVSNCGGLLTPLGDPPLFLGYLRGAPFTWTLGLWPIWLLANGYLLLLFYFVDRRAYAREASPALDTDRRQVVPLGVNGWGAFPMLAVIVGAVFMPTPIRELTMLGAAALSFFLGTASARRMNGFEFGPILEVAILFLGIFVTMIPALEILHHQSSHLGLSKAWQYFLATGSLSSVLDNAPTYLAFLSAAQGLGLAGPVLGVPHWHLVAISVGAVLMGANTYIGNGPNFMVKAIAESAGYRTPNFLSYAGIAVAVLSPVYAVVTAVLLLN